MTNIMIFSTVIMTGFGCGIGCGSISTPLLIGKMIGEGRNKRECIKAVSIFTLGKISIYIILGLLVSVFGGFIIEYFGQKFPSIISNVFRVISIIFAFIIILNIVKHKQCSCCKSCKANSSKFERLNKMSYFIIGLIYGLIPCSPLIISLTYAATLDIFLAMALMLCFGVANSIFSVIIYAPLIGQIVIKIKEEIPQYYKIVQLLSAGIILLMAFNVNY
ncbi:putative membrane protein [Clostridium bornimense]|uniref:Putative membrane protein n=1 Tax=Clostridium bornimense TaxID=1216932 RepID=W6S061_9CLOT|nr:sulfite exporter TauE/SafE family protein [Clostridium bornimense]CDM70296.1 putative membrane protein [Clostridium bornimense]